MQNLFLQFKKVFREKRGVTVLIASLVASILLAIGLSIYNTTIKDLFFASSGNQSSKAFYAADSAAECALYWDYQGAFPATGKESVENTPLLDHGSGRLCNGRDITEDLSGDYGDNWEPRDSSDDFNAKTIFYFNVGMCAKVTVTKTDPDQNGTIHTTIQSLGYNNCNPLDPRRVERGVELKY